MPAWYTKLMSIKYMDKVGHYFLYVAVQILAFWILSLLFVNYNWLAFKGSVVCTVLCFLMQEGTQWESGHWKGINDTLGDIIADILGIITGLVICWYCF